MKIDDILERIHSLPAASKALLVGHIRIASFPKGHLLFQADKIETKFYFIRKGIARAYSDAEETEITFWFGAEGDPVISMRSYIERKPGYENIELLEDCELYEIHIEDLQKLFKHDIHIANWGRKFAELELLKTEERLIARQFKTASERYKILSETYPMLLKRVQLGHIASFLGITQVSLSRIRAEVK